MSTATIAGLTFLERGKFSFADPDPSPKLAIYTEDYPSRLKHGSGATLEIDRTRVLLGYKNAQSILQKLQFDKLFIDPGLVRESALLETEAADVPSPRNRVNDTPKRVWVRSKNGKPIVGKQNEKAISFLLGLLREEESPEALNWVAPVYRFPGTTGDNGLVCPLPHVLLIKPARNVEDKVLEKELQSLQLAHIREISKYLVGYRYYKLIDATTRTVYQLQERFRKEDRYRRLVEDVQLDFTPFHVPTAAFQPSDEYYCKGHQWNLGVIAAEAGWNASDPPCWGENVIVAIIDSGCDLDHPDLQGSYYLDPSAPTGSPPGATFDTSSSSPISYGGGPDDGPEDDPHGTWCAGVVAARYHLNSPCPEGLGEGLAGLAGGCWLMPLRIVGFDLSATAAAVGYAVEHAANRGALVISMSFTGDGTKGNPKVGSTGDIYRGDVIDNAIAYAFESRNVVLCAASGNKNESRLYRPGSHDYVLACGASAKHPPNTRWEDGLEGSTYGERPLSGTDAEPPSKGLSVVAPGKAITTTHTFLDAANNRHHTYKFDFSRTSAATPHVAGLAALLLSKHPNLSNVEVYNIIERTAEKVNASTYVYEERTETEPLGNHRFPKDTLRYPNGPWNDQMGYGRINVGRALTFADVLIKDWPEDTGIEPSTPPDGNFWSFSDIVIRPTDDAVFLPTNPLESRKVVRGQDNYLYVQVTNKGPNVALNVQVNTRITHYVGTEFVYPADWTAIDADHVGAEPLVATFASIPRGGTAQARFKISSAQVETLWGWTSGASWHPCLLAEVGADNDYAFASASMTGGNVIVRKNNFAQSNLSVIEVSSGDPLSFPFLVGNRFNMDQMVKVLIAFERYPDLFHPFPELPPGPQPLPPILLSLDEIPKPLASLGTTAKVGKVGVEGGKLILKGEARFVEIAAEKTTVTLEREPKQLHALALQAVIPQDAKKGQKFVLKVTQTNARGVVVGGATVIYVVGKQA